jgi:hypothetical protein
LANNGIAVIGYYMLQHKYIEVSPDAIGTGEMSVLQWMSSVVLTIVGLVFFKRAVNRLQQPEVELSEVNNNSSEGLS